MTPSLRTVGLRFLAIVVGLASAAPASAQYQYVPPQDYYRNDTAQGTIVGGGLGAGIGALIGAQNDETPEGALIGAGVGAIAGNLFGRHKDTVDRRNAAQGYAVTQQANAQAQAMALTNYDLVEMTRAGLDDGVIVTAMQSRGARIDLSPSGLIQLKQSGVSDRVVMAAQQMGAPPAPAPTTYVAPAPRTVIVERPPVYYYPAPRVYIGTHYGHGWHHCDHW